MKKVLFATIALSLLCVMIFIIQNDGKIIARKAKILYSEFSKDKEQLEVFSNNSVLAADSLIVNSLPTCTFTNGSIGDIFAKNSGCSWSDYKCTLTDYNTCNSGVGYLGNPFGDYCWCDYNSSKICGIQLGINDLSCWSWENGSNYSEFCNLCVRR